MCTDAVARGEPIVVAPSNRFSPTLLAKEAVVARMVIGTAPGGLFVAVPSSILSVTRRHIPTLTEFVASVEPDALLALQDSLGIVPGVPHAFGHILHFARDLAVASSKSKAAQQPIGGPGAPRRLRPRELVDGALSAYQAQSIFASLPELEPLAEQVFEGVFDVSRVSNAPFVDVKIENDAAAQWPALQLVPEPVAPPVVEATPVALVREEFHQRHCGWPSSSEHRGGVDDGGDDGGDDDPLDLIDLETVESDAAGGDVGDGARTAESAHVATSSSSLRVDDFANLSARQGGLNSERSAGSGAAVPWLASSQGHGAAAPRAAKLPRHIRDVDGWSSDSEDGEGGDAAAAVAGAETVDRIPAPMPEFLEEKDFQVVSHPGPYYRNDDSLYGASGTHSSSRPKQLAAMFVPKAIPTDVCKDAANGLRAAATLNNRRHRTNGGQPPKTGIVGHYDYLTNPIRHKCRLTKYTRDNYTLIADTTERFVHALDQVYRRACPDHHRLQLAAVPPQHRLFGSSFSTLSVNDTFRTAKHTDKGDFRSGLGVVCVLDGSYSGVHLGFPGLGLAFDLRPGDVILFDTSLEHGNTEPHVVPWSRLGIVAYFRSGLASQRCEQEHRERLMRRLGPVSAATPVVDVNKADPRLPALYMPREILSVLTSVQRAAVGFAHRRAASRSGCIAAMGMGLGKSLVALVLAFSSLSSDPTKDVMILTPKSVLGHWHRELQRWHGLGLAFPYVTVFQDSSRNSELVAGHMEQRRLLGGAGGLIIVNPESVRRLVTSGIAPSLILADEGHKVSSRKSGLADLLDAFATPARVVLTGTPMQNTTDELHGLMQWVNPTVAALLPRSEFLRRTAAIERFASGDDSMLEEAAEAQAFLCGWLRGHVFRARDNQLPPLRDWVIVLEPTPLTVGVDMALGDVVAAQREDKTGGVKKEAVEGPGTSPVAAAPRRQRLRARSVSRGRVSSRASSVASDAGMNDEADFGGEDEPFVPAMTRNTPSAFSGAGVSASQHGPLHLTAHPRCLMAFELRNGDNFPSDPTLRIASARYLQESGGAFGCASAEPDLSADSAKMQASLAIAMDAKSAGEQVVIFTQYIIVQEAIAGVLEANGVSAVCVDGSMSSATREAALNHFVTGAPLHPTAAGATTGASAAMPKRAPTRERITTLTALANSPTKAPPTARSRAGGRPTALVLSAKVGAFGIDLTNANTVILFDSWWNPQLDQQAVARCHRRNQTREVRVYRLCTAGSVEERVLQAQLRKLALFAYCVDGAASQASIDFSTSADDAAGPNAASAPLRAMSRTAAQGIGGSIAHLCSMRIQPPSSAAMKWLSPWVMRGLPPTILAPAEPAASSPTAKAGGAPRCCACGQGRAAHDSHDEWLKCRFCDRRCGAACAGIVAGATALEDSALFVCPVCAGNGRPLVRTVHGFAELVRTVEVAFD